MNNPKFTLGSLVATPGALKALEESGQSPMDFLSRHVRGDWGDLDTHDRRCNDQAVKDGGRILSSYKTSQGETIWVITDAADDQGRRASTCILLPEEY